MADIDIAHLIQVIYEKYNETQKDKKREERVYMNEDEFKANLAVLVKKSSIEDKYMLYNEIFRKISADALEIDSTGKITISSKVIIAAEEEVIRRQEEKTKETIEGVTPLKEKNTSDVFNMSKEEYDKLSHEEKRNMFADATEEIFGSKEKAQEVFEEVSRSKTTTNQNAVIDAQQKVNDGVTLNVADLKKIYGENVKITGDNVIQKNILDRTLLIQTLAQSNEFAAFYTTSKDEGSYELDTQFITAIFMYYKKNKDVGKDESILSDLVKEFLSNRKCSEEQINAMIQLAEDKDKFEVIAKGLIGLSMDFNLGKDFISGTGLPMDIMKQFYDGTVDFYQMFKGILKNGINDRTITDNEKFSIESYFSSVERYNAILSSEKRHTKIDQEEKMIMWKEDKPLDGYSSVSNVSPKNIISSYATLGMEEAFEESLASISDMEPDMFADMFSDMAEEMVFEETPTYETEKVVQEEAHEVVVDNGITQGEQEIQINEEIGYDELTENEVKGIQVEDIAVAEDLTNERNDELLPKKITWVDRAKAAVDALGKNVKKAFGSFISAITGKGGENNSEANNTTTSTSSNAGQNKPVQEVNPLVQTVELNVKQAQAAVKAAEEAKKNNDARGTDEPTQDDSEIGE